MSHVLRIGVSDQIGYFRAYNDDGTAKTDLTAAEILTLSVFRVGLAPVAFVSSSDKAADNSVHTDGAIRKVGGNLYTIDLPDAATATQTPSVGVRGTFNGGEIEPIPHPIVNYDPSLAAVGANTVVPPAASSIASQTRTELASELGRIDVAISTRSTFAGGAVASVTGSVGSVTSPVTVGTSNDKTGYSLSQAFPSNFASLGINASGHVNRVTVVDTTSVNADMRGTDGANTVTPPTLAQLEARTLPAADYFNPDTDTVDVGKIAGVPAVVADEAVNFPLTIGTSVLSPFNVQTVLNDYGTARTVDVTAVETKVTNLQTRLPAALVGGKVDAYIAPSDRTGYVLDAPYQASLVAAIDAALLDEGDATDLIASIVARIGNTNVDEAALVAAIKASLFSAGSIANKLDVDGVGRVTVGTNADKSNYALASDQAVNVTKVGGTAVSGPDELMADVSGLSTLTASQVWSHINRTLTEFAFPVTVDTNHDKTGYELTQAFPSNFASLGINVSGHISRVTLVDTTTVNLDMRGTDNALLASAYSTGPSAATIADAVWDVAQSGHTTPGTFGSFIDASISSVSTGGESAGDIASAVRSELTTELGRIDVAVSSRSTFAGGAVASVTGAVGSVASPVVIGTNNDKAGYSLNQDFPSNFASLGINASGHISRVSLVDTTTTNADMRGTDSALLATNYTAPANADIAAIKAKIEALPENPEGVTAAEIWQHAERTLTSATGDVVIDVEALAAEIADALTSSGLYRLTIEAFDETLQAVPGVQVQILGVAGTSRTIGSSGKTTIDLDPGTFTLRVNVPNGYAPVPDREIQIVDADITETINLVSFLPNIEPPPGTCAFTVRVASQAGSNLVSIPVSAKLPKGYVVNADTLHINLQTSQPTNVDGLAALILLRDQPYELVIRRPDGGIVTIPIRTPDAEQATLSQVIEI